MFTTLDEWGYAIPGITIHRTSVQPARRGLGFPYQAILLISALFPGAALACIGGRGALDIPLFFVALFVTVIAIGSITFVVWAVQKLFFNKTASGRSRWASVFLASGIITSFILGAIGTFVVPAFSEVFTSFGADLPIPTQVLISANLVLWLPALLLLFSLRASNSRFNQTRYAMAVLLCEVFLLSLVLWALYSPIFVLGCIV